MPVVGLGVELGVGAFAAVLGVAAFAVLRVAAFAVLGVAAFGAELLVLGVAALAADAAVAALGAELLVLGVAALAAFAVLGVGFGCGMLAITDSHDASLSIREYSSPVTDKHAQTVTRTRSHSHT